MQSNGTRRRLSLYLALSFALPSTALCPLLAQEKKPVPQMPALAEESTEGISAMDAFRVPETLKCSLFAAEPMVGNPVAFAFDRFGRVFVCESYRQNKGVTDNRGHDAKWLDADLATMTIADRIKYHRELLGKEAAEYEKFDDIIRVLEDTNNDGKADRGTVFASGFNGIEEGTGAGVLIRDNMVYYTNIPKLWGLKDTNGDLVADERIVLSDGYGVRVAFRGHDMHGLIIGPDGRLYFSIGDRGYSVETPEGKFQDPESGAVFRCELDGSKLEVYATGLRNPQELAFDDEGNLFTCDNNSDSGDKARWTQIVRGGDTGWRMMYQYLSDRGPFNREKIWYPYSPESPAYIVPPIANISDGPSGLVCYPGVGLDGTPGLKNAFFLCDFRGQSSNSGIRRIQLKPNGATFEIAKNEEYIWNLLATDVDFAPDGSMLVSDWVNGWNGENKGRLYRFDSNTESVKETGAESAKLLKQGAASMDDASLLSLFKHVDRRVRLEAQWELAKRGKSKLLADLFATASTRNEKLHAVWGLGQIARSANDSIATTTLQTALEDSDEYVVARACEMLADSRFAIQSKQLLTLAKHVSPVVQTQAMLAIGKRKATAALEQVAAIVVANQDRDPVLRHAASMAFAGAIDDAAIAKWSRHPEESVRVVLAVALRKAKNVGIASLLDDSSLRVVREAARAIYDVPDLNAVLPSLASLTIAKEFDEPITRRILHANYRLGNDSNIDRLVQFAVSDVGNDSMRGEALSLLGDWEAPGLRDKIMNRHHPLENRSTKEVISRLQQNVATLAAASDGVRDKFFAVATKFEMKEIASLLVGILEDAKATPKRRADAIVALNALKPEALDSVRNTLLVDPQPVVRVAALKSLLKKDEIKGIEALKNAIGSSDTMERQSAWDLVSTIDASKIQPLLEAGMDNYARGTLPTDCMLNFQDAVKASGTDNLKKKITKIMNGRSNKQAADPRAAYVDCLEGGNVDAGRELFFTRSNLSCVRCHKVGPVGGEVGPILSELGKQKDRGYLLEAIVAPNAAIAQGFETTIILTDDDETISGVLKSEDNKVLRVMDAQGLLIEVEKETIVNRKKGQSSMPADLMKYLTRRELRDLVAYLASLDGSENAIKKFGDAGGHSVE
jgi:quinoprotein glucose dehydrogenase